MIPIPVWIDAMLAILNLPKEMGDNGIFKEHKAIVMETIRTLVLQVHYIMHLLLIGKLSKTIA